MIVNHTWGLYFGKNYYADFISAKVPNRREKNDISPYLTLKIAGSILADSESNSGFVKNHFG